MLFFTYCKLGIFTQCYIVLIQIVTAALHCAMLKDGTVFGSRKVAAAWPCDTLITGFAGFTKAVGIK